MTPPSLFMNVIDGAMDRLLFGLGGLKALSGFYLAGGTALALQLGHRTSVDLDLFRREEWSVEVATNALAGLGGVEVELVDSGTLWARVDDIRVSLFHYPYRLVGELVPAPWGVPLASLLDIACMKLVAVSQRGSRKDFVDLYFLARSGIAPRDALVALAQKAVGVTFNPVHIARSLAYFEDAEAEPDPAMLSPYDWPEIRRFFLSEARDILRGSGAADI
jgi:hypothetical protein